MNSTALDLIENLLYLIEEKGFVPNGARVYYDHRSQPPLATQLVHSFLLFLQSSSSSSSSSSLNDDIYIVDNENNLNSNNNNHNNENNINNNDNNDKNKNNKKEKKKIFERGEGGITILELLEKSLPLLDKEYSYWMANRSVEITNENNEILKVNKYEAQSNLPRPEGYFNDVQTALSAGVSHPLLVLIFYLFLSIFKFILYCFFIIVKIIFIYFILNNNIKQIY